MKIYGCSVRHFYNTTPFEVGSWGKVSCKHRYANFSGQPCEGLLPSLSSSLHPVDL